MGNHGSFSHEQQQNSDEKLLRRNMRIHSTFNQQTSFLTSGSVDARNSLVQGESHRQSRSKSLEPRATQEIRIIEHSKSARYGKNKKQLPKLWDPEETRLNALKQQLSNPTSSPRPSLMDQYQEFQKQMLSKRVRKSCHSIDIENFTEMDQLPRSITGLSAHQTQILQKIWTRATESEVIDSSQNIFAHLLRSNVHMYEFFNLVGMTDKEVVGSTTFAKQSANFAMVFDFVITNMADDVERLCFALQSLGERHTRLIQPIEETHWALFTRVFEDNPPIVFQNAEGHTVWKLMIGFVVIQMRIGYTRGLENRKTMRPSISPTPSPRSQSAQNQNRLRRQSKRYSTSKRSTTLT